MARIELAPEVFDDFDRFFEQLAQFEITDAPERLAEIVQAFQILTHSPLIGRPVRGGKRASWSSARTRAGMSRCTASWPTSIRCSFSPCEANVSRATSASVDRDIRAPKRRSQSGLVLLNLPHQGGIQGRSPVGEAHVGVGEGEAPVLGVLLGAGEDGAVLPQEGRRCENRAFCPPGLRPVVGASDGSRCLPRVTRAGR